MVLSACGSSPTAPPPPPPDAPTLSCPASVSLVSPDGARVPFPFPLPTPVNGQPPVTVSCSGMPGGGYPAGSTTVTCTATDALARQASCNFTVTVTVTPKISKTKYLAFGDSITYGRCGPKPNECPPYTIRLGDLLRERYTAQTFTIPGDICQLTAPAYCTSGKPGEKATQGQDRLAGVLDTYKPEVLLLMEGTNDVLFDPFDLDAANDAIENMIDIARNRGVSTIFLATIPPIVPGGPNNSAVSKVLEMNNEIRDIAAKKGVFLVDVFAALNADLSRYYTGDDVHPNAEGLQRIGEAFYAVIREKLDVTPTGTSFSRR